VKKSPLVKKKSAEAQPSLLFEQLKNLWTKEKPVNTKTKVESIYMINRFLSLTADGFLAACDLNRFRKLPVWAQLPFLYYSLPEKPAPWKTYPKVPGKDKLTPKQQVALDRICNRFCVKEFHGKQIVDILQMQGIIVEAD
jgi:hypothetical protein